MIIWEDPSLGANVVLFTPLTHACMDVPIHEVFPAQLPSAWEMIAMLVHVIIPQGLRLQGSTPHYIRVGTLSLREASPSQRVDHTVVCMHSVCNFVLQMELILLHLVDVLFVNGLLFSGDFGRILEEHCWRSP